MSEVAEIGASGAVAAGIDTSAGSDSTDFFADPRFAGAFLAVADASDTSTTGADLAARFTGAFAGSLTGACAAALAGALRAGFFATADSSAMGAFVSSFFTISGALQAA